jgi:hypothetical protein
MSMPSLGDRRRRVRLEVVGDLWATVEMNEPARILEISQGGALIVSSVAAAPDSLRVLTLRVDDTDVTVDVQIRHVRALPATAEQPVQYLLGVEFLTMPATLTHALE